VVWQHVLGVACVLCVVQNGTELGCVFFVAGFVALTLERKHVGAISK
jgi:hypothetical protein